MAPGKQTTDHPKFIPGYLEKIIGWMDLREWIVEARTLRSSVILTDGCFDVLHIGHIHFLQDAKKKGDLLAVAVHNDSSVRKLKGPDRPILPANQRSELVAALGCVDRVVLFDGTDMVNLVKVLKPDVYAGGISSAATILSEFGEDEPLRERSRVTGNSKERSTRDIVSMVQKRHRCR